MRHVEGYTGQSVWPNYRESRFLLSVLVTFLIQGGVLIQQRRDNKKAGSPSGIPGSGQSKIKNTWLEHL